MQKIRIITDSASDLRVNYDSNITVLPMKINFGDTEYKDGIDLSKREFYEKLIENDELPSTSLVSPADFTEAYEDAVSNGEKAIVITISSKLSGTYQSAVIAAAEFSDNIYVVDSKNAAIGEQILVLLADKLIKQNTPIEEIIAQLELKREKIHLIALLDTLEYLKKGGRISSSAALIGSALSIKPIIAIKNGEVAMIGKARGSKNGNNYLIKEIEGTLGVDFSMPICLGYTGLNDDLLKKYITDSEQLWHGHINSLEISPIGATIGTHIGPGAIAVAFFEI